MKVHCRLVDSLDVAKLRVLGARRGWLIESPDSMHVGFGRPLAAEVLDGGLASSSTLSVFNEIDVECDADAGAARPIAFASAPFERGGPLRAWVPEHQVSVTPDGTISLLSRDPARATAEIEAVSRDGLDAVYDATVMDFAPSPDGYARAVAQAVELMRHGELQKVVLARRVAGHADRDIDPAVVADRLHEREPSCTLYSFPAGPNERFVGASPELVVANYEGAVAAHPLAGTIALPTETDGPEYATWLMGSTKNLFEHQVVVDDIVERLSTRCDDVRADPRPSVVTLRSVAHLGTWIHGKVAASEPASALDLLSLVHPTAAVGGIPQRDAVEVIHRLEAQPRGLYAGAVGWLDAAGSGEWWLAIRGITLEGARFAAWAGAGIVADSDPVAEREETRDKLASVLAGLGGATG